MWTRLVLLFALISNVNSQTAYCVTGFIMDTFCIKLGTLLDNPSLRTLRYPANHTIHCLVDVPSCVSGGYEVLTTPPAGKTDFVRAAKLDAVGNKKVVQMARAVGSCGTCNVKGTQKKGFRATVKGLLYKNTVPPTLKVTQLLNASVKCV